VLLYNNTTNKFTNTQFVQEQLETNTYLLNNNNIVSGISWFSLYLAKYNKYFQTAGDLIYI